LVTDDLPAMALGLDQSEDDVMRRGPRNPKEGIFARGLGFKIVSPGIVIGLVTLVAIMLAYQGNPDNLIYGQTVAFTTLMMSNINHVFDCRSEHSIFVQNPYENKYLVLSVISSVFLLLVVIYWAPLQPVFHTTALNLRDWMLVLALSFLPSVLFGFTKK